jgi:hypothetical protein
MLVRLLLRELKSERALSAKDGFVVSSLFNLQIHFPPALLAFRELYHFPRLADFQQFAGCANNRRGSEFVPGEPVPRLQTYLATRKRQVVHRWGTNRKPSHQCAGDTGIYHSSILLCVAPLVSVPSSSPEQVEDYKAGFTATKKQVAKLRLAILIEAHDLAIQHGRGLLPKNSHRHELLHSSGHSCCGDPPKLRAGTVLCLLNTFHATSLSALHLT